MEILYDKKPTSPTLEGLLSWKLEYRMDGQKEYTLLKEGSTDVKDGELEDAIMDNALHIIKDIDQKCSLNDGPLQIRTYIRNIKTEIRIFVREGELINFDLFKGWSTEIKKNSIDWY